MINFDDWLQQTKLIFILFLDLSVESDGSGEYAVPPSPGTKIYIFDSYLVWRMQLMIIKG